MRVFGAVPTSQEICIDAKEIENAADGMVDDVIDRLWARIHRGHWRRDDGAKLGGLIKQFAMPGVER